MGMEKPLEFEKPIAELEEELEALRCKAEDQNLDLGNEMLALQEKLTGTRKQIYENLSPWQRVQIARHVDRPFFLDYLDTVSYTHLTLPTIYSV